MSFRRPLTLLLAVPALLVGCSAAPAAPSTTPPPAISVNPPTSVPTGANTTTSAAPAAACPSGEYRATGFTAVGANAASGKGKVTDVGVTFRDGRYTFDFADAAEQGVLYGDIYVTSSESSPYLSFYDISTPSDIAFGSNLHGYDVFVTVDDMWAEEAVRLLHTDGIDAGESGAAGLAGLLAERVGLGLGPDDVVLVFLTEGPTDPDNFRRIISG